VWSTKYRQPLIDDAIKVRLYQYIGGIIKKQGACLIEIGGMPDHVHLLLVKQSLGKFEDDICKIKADSSRWVNKQFDSQKKHFSWQEGYGSFTVSSSQTDNVQKYIKNQLQHHQKISFKEEYLKLLDKHGVQYELKYVFD